jgi:hypothetical protein
VKLDRNCRESQPGGMVWEEQGSKDICH